MTVITITAAIGPLWAEYERQRAPLWPAWGPWPILRPLPPALFSMGPHRALM